MRFHENGPNIPDELISAQRRGNVVFFCGAGISVPAKLPSFLGLAYEVMRTFGVSKASNLGLGIQLEQIEEALKAPRHSNFKLSFSLDQTFYLLQQEYGKAAVAQEVLIAVAVPKDAPVDGHQDILRLARSRDGTVQVVTTNFDLLFEQADSGVKSYVPPALPSLANGEKLNGVVYLHGKWDDIQKNPSAASNLIVSSADFGRAYLADGWASTFIKELAQQYVIVLLGYSAEDPPVRYLLEGLHARGNTVDSKIYSFERGSLEEVNQNWQHRGVTGIAFDTFPTLWESLKTWATYSEEPKKWNRKVIEMAQELPSTLKPYQRGQVAFLISTVEGARIFSEATPPPPAEWLCVFDSRVRNGKPTKRRVASENEIYSFQEHFALDDDVYLAVDSEEVDIPGRDYLSEFSADERRHFPIGLTKAQTPLPPRLAYLAVWLIQILNQPISLWWIAGQSNVSDQLRGMLENRLRRPESSSNKQLDEWWTFLEQKENDSLNFDFRLFRFRDAVTVQGWNPRMLHSFEEALKPVYQVTRRSATPPNDEDKVVDITIRLPKMSGLDLHVPDEKLVDVIRIYRSCLDKYVQLSGDSALGLYPDFLDVGEDQLNADAYIYVDWFKKLYAELTRMAPEHAVSEVSSWPLNDPKIFAPLRVVAWQHLEIWLPSTVLEGILALPEKFFWRNKRYLSPLAGAYWTNFSSAEKDKFLAFVRTGPSEEVGYPSEDRVLNEVSFSAPFLLALQDNGCELDASSQKLIERAQLSEYWTPISERNDYSSARFIRRTRDTQPGRLLTAHVSEIVDIAENSRNQSHFSISSYEPFEGLVTSKGIRAYRGLAYAMKMERYPTLLWKDFLASLPQGTSRRLYLCAIERTIRLPLDEFISLQHSISSFLEKILPSIAVSDHARAIAIWDIVFSRLIAGNKGDIETQDNENFGLRGYVLNAPLAQMLNLLISLYYGEKIPREKAMKAQFLQRLDMAMNASVESRKILVNMGIADLRWFNHRFPNWTKENLVNRLCGEHEDREAAWNGFLSLRYTLPPSLFMIVKQDFLDVFGKMSKWPWGKNLSRALHGHYLHYCNGKGKVGKYLTEAEAREILQRTDDNGRVNVLHRLPEGGNWMVFQKRFLRNIWPRELKYMNSRVSSALVRIAIENEVNFSEVIPIILPYMTYVTHADHNFYSSNGAIMRLASRHPSEMLSLLNAAVGERTVTLTAHVASILDAIEAASMALESDHRMRRLREYVDHHPY